METEGSLEVVRGWKEAGNVEQLLTEDCISWISSCGDENLELERGVVIKQHCKCTNCH